MKAIGTYFYHEDKTYFMNPEGTLVVSDDVHNQMWEPVFNPPKGLYGFIDDFILDLENSIKKAKRLRNKALEGENE